LETFEDKFKKPVADYYSGLKGGKAEKAEKVLQSQYWSYSVPGYPALVSIDTRTDRSYASDGGTPKLMSERGFNWLKKTLTDLGARFQDQREEQTLLLLSPAPVFGFKPIEMIQKELVAFFKSGETAVDAEYWSANEETYEGFLQTLDDNAFTRDVIFLSGDVHYSYCVLETEIGKEKGGADRYIQVTSSAICNHPSESGAWFMELIDDHMDRTPDFSYLVAQGQKRVVNPDNSVGALWFSDGVPVQAIGHFFDPKKKVPYKWVYNLKKPVLKNA
ncbi:MAG: hypothetical protein KDD60_07815, partial [Bdellovibrionales bacterium]|nr:hypothetical protein [Bdellovibrionales bacterium]